MLEATDVRVQPQNVKHYSDVRQILEASETHTRTNLRLTSQSSRTDSIVVVVVSSRTDLDDDVVDVTSFPALDVFEIK